MSDLTLILARMEQAEAITAIKTRAYNAEIRRWLGRDGGPEGYNSVDSQRDILTRFSCYGIWLGGELIGALFVIEQGSAAYRLEDLVIDPPYQHKGYGSAAIRAVEALYPDARLWSLCTPDFCLGNRRLYARLGYREVGIAEGLVEFVKEMEVAPAGQK